MARNDWQLQLVDPTGKVWELGNMGYAASTGETSYALFKVREYLLSEECNWNGKDFVLAGVWQTFLNSAFYPYHNFRLVWGPVPNSPSEIGKFSAYSNGKDIEWHLVYSSNGRVQKLLSGSLPEGWWELEEEERAYQLENVL